ncbi:isocitrate lyase/PEP mutase family protein [Catellatospora bangladeshensis]|uniref:Methylisocitrate lyase n=1 Tax=Catellatospora bangladeshensis TaxID=310355 RepID=A0A8J3JQ33_9ACTN|nr:isocitrate lyase/PEP mutase family protein [Catellatospora bangladeshensis]GIF82950.1 hypothetical protein Cba03nite_42990 [Catellatospora bangladeshensis]
MTAAALRALLASGRVTHLPGVYDPPTATLAVRAGHRAAHLSGAACAALDLGLPDLGYVHGTHLAERASRLVPALGGAPLLADADTGYGDALQAVWTARRYAAAGISGLHLEDQVQPKRCGHLAGKELIGADAAARKIRAVTGDGTGLVVVARTDAYSVNGLDDAIARARAYAAAGADAVFLEGVSDLDELAHAHAALPGVPLVLNRSEAAGAAPRGAARADDCAADGNPEVAEEAQKLPATPETMPPGADAHPAAGEHRAAAHNFCVVPTTQKLWATDADLAAVGVRLVLHPVAPLLAALRAAADAYAAIAATGHATGVDRMAWSAFTSLVGQDDALALDARYAV